VSEEPTYTDLAVAVGRLEEGQKHVLSGVDELKTIVHAAIEGVTEIRQDRALDRKDINDLQEWRSTAERDTREAKQAAEARKPPWTAIAAVVLAGFAIVKDFFGL
jgi:hypothetical protein